jgi:AbrB family looped-hinge helix DNA binding protein
MSTTSSKLTSQGQISIPAKIRRKLGLHPGSTVEWEEDGERVFVRRAGRFTFEEIHRSVFQTAPTPRSLAELKAGVRQHIKGRHARD